MKTTNNTVLISGGSAGIGLEIAKLLSEKGNKVIITGRNEVRLQQAASQLKNVSTIVSDVSNVEDVENLVSQIKSEFPDLNMVINNAGRALVYDITEENVNAFEKAEDEMLTNYLSIIRLNEKLLPVLKTNDNPTIVNVSSVVAFVPGALATYSASKAALHSYTRYLRLALKNANVKVFELMPPLVDTEFSAPIGGKNGIPASFVAEQFIAGLEEDNYEIRVGQTEDIYRLYLSSPEDALLAMNQRRTQEVGE
ncbi:SDR family oxidoreductase [Epilithonimonas pallida]|uniref:Uncharacterized oxidoreductase n=1 Tax=Epilithonimonas pallida TaxID=373671 RepID=A0ABY1R309_9FLAO|nr:SDR family NAD(P)-dependent oxidoreductase [Epilithonimonas pallida]SMP92393.1 uncharacterized oxidoreductase [Epilithonimonas pallida]